MSTHCSKYPNCGCPEEVGLKCHEHDIESKFHKMLQEISETPITDNRQPNLNYGISKRGTRKVRKSTTNLTPKKKKRKR